MTRVLCQLAIAALASAASALPAAAANGRVREVGYDPAVVVTVPVRRGVVTHILLDPDEAITEVATGLGSDCSKTDAVWCVAAQPGGRSIFVKAKSGARKANNLAVVTDQRTHSFLLSVLADDDPHPPVYRLTIHAPVIRTVVAAPPPVSEPPPASPSPRPLVAAPSADELVGGRLTAKPQVVNSDYSIAEGDGADDIVPTLVFDDGRFTYFRFPGNRELPAVFHVLGDGSETLVNTRMEDDLLVVDRVARRLTLRAGAAVVGVWNEAFDLDGIPPLDATTVPGVARTLKTPAGQIGLRSEVNR